jgi:acetyl esterase/lipase
VPPGAASKFRRLDPKGRPELKLKARWAYPSQGPSPQSFLREADADALARSRWVLYLHGGGFNLCKTWTYTHILRAIAVRTGAFVVCPSYRRAPEHKHPAALDDCFTTYRWLLSSGVPANRIVVVGDSAGGALAALLLSRLADKLAKDTPTGGGDGGGSISSSSGGGGGGVKQAAADAPPAALAMAGGAVLVSPWVDLADYSSPSWGADRGGGRDFIPERLCRAMAANYAGSPLDPTASAINCTINSRFPPVLVESGGDEVFGSQIAEYAVRLREAGVDCRHEETPGAVHVGAVLFGTKAKVATESFVRMIEFLEDVWGERESQAGDHTSAGADSPDHDKGVVEDVGVGQALGVLGGADAVSNV